MIERGDRPTLALARLDIAVEISAGGAVPSEAVTRETATLAPELEALLGDAVRRPLERALLGPNVQVALQWLHDAGILGVALPEIDATVDFGQEMGRKHKDVWEHTKQVVEQAAPTPPVRWAALLHDVGKVPTRAIDARGKVTFYGHAEVGAQMFDRVARRLAFPAALAQEVRFLVLHHLRANSYESKWSDSAVRRFARELAPYLDDLVLLSRADITSARPQKREHGQRKLDDLVARMAALAEIDARRPPLPSGVGHEIMTRFGVARGRLVGELKRELEAAIARGDLEAHREAAYYLDTLADDPRLANPDGDPDGDPVVDRDNPQ